MKKCFLKKVITLSTILALSVTLFSVPAFAESRTELGLKQISVTDKDPNLLGDITPEAIKEGQDKSALSQKIVEIWDKSVKKPESVTESDRKTIQTYIDKYAKGNSVDKYIYKSSGNSSKITAAAIGDGVYKYLGLPGIVQSKDNYCSAATCYAILQGRGINVSETTMAQRLGIYGKTNGAYLSAVCPALNYYNGYNGNNFKYALSTGPGSYTSAWETSMTNNAIATLLGNYGVVYDVHMVNSSGSARLSGYETMYSSDIRHYVAGEGFNGTNPSAKTCYYYDSNNLKSFTNRHLWVYFSTMARLTDDMGICY
ncbi:C39 family peptidase [Desulfosporosinus sp. FKA]|uniref:C39 family peptidase n=1 Tax=Desulfosporosinus sp. FKA TaxID=1969834 RepID=UPI001554645B|nr:C39 family peptidase [Desulfosporosinus sp. FKA]